MDVINFSETRANLKSVMDQVVRDRTPVVVSRKNGEAVVMVSLADWNATEETAWERRSRSSTSARAKNTNSLSREARLRVPSLAGLPVLAG
jgi:antitoxin YefM